MHLFLQGPRGIGKSTVLRRTLELLQVRQQLTVAGLRSYKGEPGDNSIYLTGYGPQQGPAAAKIASFDATGATYFSPQAFNELGVRLLEESAGADLIVLDELGFLEQRCPPFQAVVLACLDGNVPIFGVARQSPPEVTWLEPLRTHPRVRLQDVTLENRDALPQQLCAELCDLLQRNPNTK